MTLEKGYKKLPSSYYSLKANSRHVRHGIHANGVRKILLVDIPLIHMSFLQVIPQTLLKVHTQFETFLL